MLKSLAGILLLVGCGGSDVELASVTGTVLQEGKPLADAWIDFSPEFAGRAAGARTNDAGMFRLSYAGALQGARPGSYTIKIGTGGLPDPAVVQGIQFTPRVELFEQADVQVKPGSNSFEFVVPATGVNPARK